MMRERSLKRTSVLLAVLFGLVAMLTGFALLVGGSTHATADSDTTEAPKALYFVDAGRLVKSDTENSTYEVAPGREQGGGTYWRRSTPFMDYYGLAYGDGSNNGLLNRVADKPFFAFGGEENRQPQTDQAPESEIDGSGYAWGFLRMSGDGTVIDTDKYYWEQWSIGTTNTAELGSETMRHADSGTLSVAYKFEIPAGQQVKVMFGTSVFRGWPDKGFTARCGTDKENMVSIPSITSKNNTAQVFTFDGTFEGTKETYGGVDKNILTVSFGPDGYVSWILVYTPGYTLYEGEAAYVKNGSDSVDFLPLNLAAREANHDTYGKGTIAAADVDRLKAAGDFTYVNDVTVTMADGGVRKGMKVLALPANTKYFVNAGKDAAYNEAYGYGYTNGDPHQRGWASSDYNVSVRYVNGGGNYITYQFDKLSHGIYGVKVGGHDPWETRTTEITLNGEKGANDLTCRQGQDTDATNTVELMADGKLEVKLSGSPAPAFSYIWVYEEASEPVITYHLGNGEDDWYTHKLTSSGDQVQVTHKEPTYAEHLFLGWYTQENGAGEKKEAGEEYAGTLYAHWKAMTPSTVTFLLDEDGETHDTVSGIPYNTVMTRIPSTPTRTDYYFTGWFNGDVEFHPESEPITENLTVIAHWIKDPLADEDGYTVYTETSASSFSMISKWDGSDNLLHDGQQMYVPVGQKLVAVYTIENGTGWNAGTIISFLVGDTRYNFGPSGAYWFHGASETVAGTWNGSYDQTAVVSKGNGNVKISVALASNQHGIYQDSSKKLLQYAVVEFTDSTHITYTIKTYNHNIADEALSYKTLLCETVHTIELPNAISEFEFHMACDPENGTELKTASIKYVTLNNTYYDVTFDFGTEQEVQKVRHGQTTTAPGGLKTGYELEWVAGEEHVNPDAQIAAVTHDTVFTALWTPKNYTVTLDPNHDSLGTSTVTATYDAPLTLDDPDAYAGHVFDGWYTEAEGGDKVESGAIWQTDEEITLYAHWKVAHTVTFELHGGSGTYDPIQVGEGNKIPEPTVPTYTGYRFDGWYTDAEYNTKWNFASDTVTEDVTLHAKWVEAVTVTYDSQGGSAVDAATVDKGTAATEPTAPTKSGYTFDGWYTEDGEEWDFDTLLTEDITLYAHWTLNQYTVTFDSQSGSAVDAATVEHGGKVTKPADPTRDGYTFGGWYKDAACTEAWNFDSDTVTADTTLYAKWTQNTTPGTGSGSGSGSGSGDTTGETPAKKKGGCGSSVAAETSAILAALMLVLAGVVVLKKKAENK